MVEQGVVKRLALLRLEAVKSRDQPQPKGTEHVDEAISLCT